MNADTYNDFLKDKLFDLFGKNECPVFMEESDKPRPTVVRTNLQRVRRKELLKLLKHRGMETAPIDWTDEGIVIFSSPVPVGATPEYLCGLYTIQGASSMLPVLNLELESDILCNTMNFKTNKIPTLENSLTSPIEISDPEKMDSLKYLKDSKDNIPLEENQNDKTENHIDQDRNDSVEQKMLDDYIKSTKTLPMTEDISEKLRQDPPESHHSKKNESHSTEQGDQHASNVTNASTANNKNEYINKRLKNGPISDENLQNTVSIENEKDEIASPNANRSDKSNEKVKKTKNKKKGGKILKVLDMCAAPGGKTTHIATKIANTGYVYAYDVNKDRCNAIQSNVARLGLKNVIVVCQDSRELNMPKFFDRVLLDAPCSGTGVISKDPDVKINRTHQDVLKTVFLQKELILKAFNSLKVGGILVYSTCSVLVDENEAVVDYLVGKNIGAKVVETDTKVGINGIVRFRGNIFHPTLKKTKRVYPHIHNMDGFFVAKIIRTR